MDNGPTYTSKKFQDFCKWWDITHNTGIPYNPQGQAIVKQQHQKIKNQLFKIKKGEFTIKTSHNQLHLILLILNFFSLDNEGIIPMEKHFYSWNICSLLRALWKNLEINTWQGHYPLLIKDQGYACVFPEHEWLPRWLFLPCIKPVTAIDGTCEKTSGLVTQTKCWGVTVEQHDITKPEVLLICLLAVLTINSQRAKAEENYTHWSFVSSSSNSLSQSLGRAISCMFE
jgi:hypothetical protein